jgi:hypothetical protein
MKTRTIIQRALVSGCLVVAFEMLTVQIATGMQVNEGGASALASVSDKAKANASSLEADSSQPESGLNRPADRTSMVNVQKIETDKITSFFVRANDSKRIQLTMLVAYKAELSKAVRQIVGQNVTPLVFSVSTLPNRSVDFDPTLLRFEQRGRSWQPQLNEKVMDILPLDENEKFGGKVSDGEVHQGIVLLPAWFDPKAPITLRYGDFHYLARFAEAQ